MSAAIAAAKHARWPYLDLLGTLHDDLQPRRYLEIGIRKGASLALAVCESHAVDPAYEIERSVAPAHTLYRTTSDTFFADPAHARVLAPGFDLIFIDGMHLYEYALRDLVNALATARPGTVIVIDDIFPSSAAMAARVRATSAWTGDVWKLVPAVQQACPDVLVVGVDTRPTGLLLLVVPATPTDVARARLAAWETAPGWDQDVPVPTQILQRRGVVAANDLIASGLLAHAVAGRTAGALDLAEFRTLALPPVPTFATA